MNANDPQILKRNPANDGFLEVNGASYIRDVLEAQRVEQAKTASFTAVVGESYVATATLTVTDPAAPVNGQSFTVRVSAGTATVGTIAYGNAGTRLTRSYNSGAWSTKVEPPAFYGFNVRAYGAKGDSSTDDVTAIQAALDAAYAAGGGTVFVPASTGAYMISNRLLIDSGVTLEMDTAAIIRSTDTAEVCMIRNRNMVLDAPYTDTKITLRGGTWDYNYRGGNTAYSPTDKTSPLLGARGTFNFIGVTHLVIENVRVYDSNGFGIQIMGSYWRAENIFFDDCHKDGMHISKSDHFIIRNVYGTLGDDLVALNAVDWLTSTPSAGPITYGLVEDITSIDNPAFSTVKFLSGGENDAFIKHITVRGVKSDGPVEFYLTQDTDLETPAHTYGGLGLIEDINISDVQAETNFNMRLGNNIKNVLIQGVVAKAQTVDMIDQLGVNAQGNTCSTEFFTAKDFVISPITTGHTLFVTRVSSTVSNALLENWSTHQTSGTVSPLINIYGAVTNLIVSDPKFLADIDYAYGAINIIGTVTNLQVIGGSFKTATSGGGIVYFLDSGTVTNLSLTGVKFDGQSNIVLTPSTAGALNLNVTGCFFKNVVTGLSLGNAANVTLTGNNLNTISSVFLRSTTSSSALVVRSAANISDGSLIIYKDDGSLRWVGHDLAITKASITATAWDTIFSTTSGDGPMIWDGLLWQKWGHL